jgi:hypothetical protein
VLRSAGIGTERFHRIETLGGHLSHQQLWGKIGNYALAAECLDGFH